MVTQRILLRPGNALEADCVTGTHRAEKERPDILLD